MERSELKPLFLLFLGDGLNGETRAPFGDGREGELLGGDAARGDEARGDAGSSDMPKLEMISDSASSRIASRIRS